MDIETIYDMIFELFKNRSEQWIMDEIIKGKEHDLKIFIFQWFLYNYDLYYRFEKEIIDTVWDYLADNYDGQSLNLFSFYEIKRKRVIEILYKHAFSDERHVFLKLKFG